MSRILRLFAFVSLLCFVLTGFAEETKIALSHSSPKAKVARFELFGGYGVLREGITPSMGLGTLTTVTNSGFGSSLTWNFSRRVGLVGDFSGSYSNNSLQSDHHFYTAMVGPRFTILRARRYAPWVQALVGGVQNNWSKVATSNAYQVSQLSSSQDIAHNLVNAGLAIRVSGGVDLPVWKHFASRTEVGWLHTQGLRAVANSSGQFTDVQFDQKANHVMFSTGLVFKF